MKERVFIISQVILTALFIAVFLNSCGYITKYEAQYIVKKCEIPKDYIENYKKLEYKTIKQDDSSVEKLLKILYNYETCKIKNELLLEMLKICTQNYHEIE